MKDTKLTNRQIGNEIKPFFASLLVGLEYFDYIIFPLLAKTFIEIFFKNQTQIWYINFLFFSLGSCLKIFGAIIFGYFFDIGNKLKIITLLAIIMVCATLSICIMPTWLKMPFAAYYGVFFIARSAQALSIGADLPTATVYMYDQNQNSCKNVTKIIMSATIGAIIAFIFVNLLTNFFDKTQIETFAWRIPLIFSTFIAIISLIGRRKNIKNSEKTKKIEKPLAKILSDFKIIKPLKLAKIATILLFPLALIDINLYFPFYFSTFFAVPIGKIYSYQLLSMFSSVIFNLIFLRFFTNFCLIRIRKLYAISIGIFIILTPFLPIISKKPLIFLILWQFFITFGLISGVFIVLSLLKIQMKSLFYGLIYNANFLITAAIPPIFIKIQNLQKKPEILFFLLTILAIISLINLFTIKNFPNQSKID